MASSDATLVERLPFDRSGDELRELYRRYAPELFGFATSALGDRELAEEVVQDVFAQLWKHAQDYDQRRASVRTWLYAIARNRVIDAHRRAAARPKRAEDVWAHEVRMAATTAHGSISISSKISRRCRSAYEVRLLTVPSGTPVRWAISRIVRPP